MLITLTTACGVSPEEKEQRRANAFDIAGRYEVKSNTTETEEIIIQIDNESDRSDVYAIIEREGFSSEEIEAFEKQNISLRDVDRFKIVLF